MPPSRTPSLLDSLKQSQELLTRLRTLRDKVSADLADRHLDVGALTQTQQELEQLLQGERLRLHEEQAALRSRVQQLEEAVQAQEAAASAQGGGLREQLAQATAELVTLRSTRDEEAALRLTRLKADREETEARLSEEKAQLMEQVTTLQQHLEASRNERQQETESQGDARQQLERDLEAARAQLAQLPVLQDERLRLREEQEMLRARVQGLEQALQNQHAAFAAEEGQLKDELARVNAEMERLRTAEDQDARRLTRLTTEWQEVQARLSEEKAQLSEHVATLQHELETALAEQSLAEASGQAAGDAECQRLERELEEARTQLAALAALREERQRLSEEQTALLAQFHGLEQNWYGREIAFAQERAGWENRLDEITAAYWALQQDSTQPKPPRPRSGMGMIGRWLPGRRKKDTKAVRAQNEAAPAELR